MQAFLAGESLPVSDDFSERLPLCTYLLDPSAFYVLS